MNKYIQYKDSNYLILSGGRVARLLKPTKIHNQQYINFIIGGKQERVNVKAIEELYNSSNANVNDTQV